jgi:hypothetical protein
LGSRAQTNFRVLAKERREEVEGFFFREYTRKECEEGGEVWDQMAWD